jgi:hypothetical protein
MIRLCAQGDILIERVEDTALPGHVQHCNNTGSVIVAEGEASGHHHRLVGAVTLYRDDALARDIPSELYVGHVRIASPSARLEHEEHAAIVLPQGTYRVRRQRQLEPTDIGLHEHFSVLGD